MSQALEIAQSLIRCASVTPNEAGTMAIISDLLSSLGFKCQRYDLGPDKIANLYAEWGEGKELYCFAGHVDVVPAANASDWRYDPFSATVKDGFLYGRGAVDMKGGVAAFLAAIKNSIAKLNPQSARIGVIITADEEGVARWGTRALIEELKKAKPSFKFSACIMAEPTSRKTLGDTLKIGRRGSLSAELLVKGDQGHVAYPTGKRNAAHRLALALAALTSMEIDKGNKLFEPSQLQITKVHCDSKASNVIPHEASAKFNIRTAPILSPAEITSKIKKLLKESVGDDDWQISITNSADAYYKESKLSESLSKSIKQVRNVTPENSTDGGTSDSRFLFKLGPVVDFGPLNTTMHSVDERIAIKDLEDLSKIFAHWLENQFA